MSIKLKDQNNNEIFIAGTNSEDFINDKVLRNDKTWSSNKIVEELYPTFQKEGNPIICYPVGNYPLNVKATFLPKQAGTGDPSPENVRPISGYDSVTVTQSKDEAQVKQITLTLPETIYGGTVDAVTGVGSEETIMFELAVADMNNDENYPGWRAVPNLTDVVGAGYNTSLNNGHFIACNITKSALTITDIGYFGVNTSSTNSTLYLTKDIFGLTQTQWKEQYPDLVLQLCLKRISPEPFQAAGNQALPAVAGLNTVYTDGDSLIISGKEDIKYTINQITSNIQNINQIQEINNILLGVE